jgi:hypothetical protein
LKLSRKRDGGDMNPYGEFADRLHGHPNPDLEFEQPLARRARRPLRTATRMPVNPAPSAPAAGGQSLSPGCIDPQFPDPPKLPRSGLTSGRLTCPSRADAYKVLRQVVANAVAMLDNTIAELTRARDAACRGEPLGWPNLGDVTGCWLKYKLGVCIDDYSVWTAPSKGKGSSRSVAEVIRRLMRPRDELATNQIKFVCETSPCMKGQKELVAWVRVTDGGKCLPKPEQLVHLCPLFWTELKTPYREQVIIHEAVHLTHCAGEGKEDEAIAASIGSPTCVAQFVAVTNGKKLDPDEAFPCGIAGRCGAVPKDIPRNCGAEFGPSSKEPDWSPAGPQPARGRRK